MTNNNNLFDKLGLRKTIQAKRRLIPQKDRLLAAKQLTQHITQSSIFTASQHIACYFSSPDEINTGILINHIWQTRKNCYLPVLDPGQSKTLVFLPYLPDDALVKNKYAISEPVFSADKIWPTSTLDLIFLPLVAFDNDGNRIGMGAGYYDRTLSQLRSSDAQNKPKTKLIGLAFELQRVESIPTEPWDIPLDGIVTETGMEIF